MVVDILNAAMAEFAQYGLGGARLDRIIANTKTSKRMVYYHFENKVGLYKAVLEHAFKDARTKEQNFDPNAGAPIQALTRFAQDAFDSLAQRPDFVRLLTFENLSGARYMKESAAISKLNQRGLAQVHTILKRGQLDGTMRTDITPLDVFINLIGLSYYHVANYAGYVAAGFSASVNSTITADDYQQHRRAMVVESTVRLVQLN